RKRRWPMSTPHARTADDVFKVLILCPLEEKKRFIRVVLDVIGKETGEADKAALARIELAVVEALEKVGGYRRREQEALGRLKQASEIAEQERRIAVEAVGITERLTDEIKRRTPKPRTDARHELIHRWISEDGSPAKPSWLKYLKRLKQEN